MLTKSLTYLNRFTIIQRNRDFVGAFFDIDIVGSIVERFLPPMIIEFIGPIMTQSGSIEFKTCFNWLHNTIGISTNSLSCKT